MTTREEKKPELVIPANFKKQLIEVIDPSQGIDYFDLGDRVFPIQVLPIGMEKKILRLGKELENDFDVLISRAAGEICHFYYPELDLGWPARNATRELLEEIHALHLKKILYNDAVISVVRQIINQIEWRPSDDRHEDDAQRYLPAHIFAAIFLYLNCVEGKSIDYVFSNVTRGLLEIIKLQNMISNDKMRRIAVDAKETEQQKAGRKMAEAKTLDEYMEGMAKQGVNLSDLFN